MNKLGGMAEGVHMGIRLSLFLKKKKTFLDDHVVMLPMAFLQRDMHRRSVDFLFFFYGFLDG